MWKGGGRGVRGERKTREGEREERKGGTERTVLRLVVELAEVLISVVAGRMRLVGLSSERRCEKRSESSVQRKPNNDASQPPFHLPSPPSTEGNSQ